jgi:hypothetical protein
MRANEFIKEDHGRSGTGLGKDLNPLHNWEKDLGNRLVKWFSPTGAWEGFKNVVGIKDNEKSSPVEPNYASPHPPHQSKEDFFLRPSRSTGRKGRRSRGGRE